MSCKRASIPWLGDSFEDSLSISIGAGESPRGDEFPPVLSLGLGAVQRVHRINARTTYSRVMGA